MTTAASPPRDFSDRRPDIAAILRVNQAGEYGAQRIYAGQLAVMGDSAPDSKAVQHMAEQEQVHLDTFNAMMAERAVRPTALQPLWNIAGFALGAGTALLGPKAAMACTAAVETEIDRHYRDQLAQLSGSDEAELSATIERFRQEELEHKAIALDKGAEDTPGYPLLSAAIRAGCRLAIGLSKRI
jgi:ubiquinone biosynthesis monooxygenase Coq7